MSPGRYAIVWQLATNPDWTDAAREHMAHLAFRVPAGKGLPPGWQDRIRAVSDAIRANRQADADRLIHQLTEGGA